MAQWLKDFQLNLLSDDEKRDKLVELHGCTPEEAECALWVGDGCGLRAIFAIVEARKFSTMPSVASRIVACRDMTVAVFIDHVRKETGDRPLNIAKFIKEHGVTAETLDDFVLAYKKANQKAQAN